MELDFDNDSTSSGTDETSSPLYNPHILLSCILYESALTGGISTYLTLGNKCRRTSDQIVSLHS